MFTIDDSSSSCMLQHHAACFFFVKSSFFFLCRFFFSTEFVPHTIWNFTFFFLLSLSMLMLQMVRDAPSTISFPPIFYMGGLGVVVNQNHVSSG